jgi:hypothetical protein
MVNVPLAGAFKVIAQAPDDANEAVKLRIAANAIVEGNLSFCEVCMGIPGKLSSSKAG